MFNSTLSAQVPSPYRRDQFLIKPKVRIEQLPALHAAAGGQVLRTYRKLKNIQLIKVPQGARFEDIIDTYRRSGLIEYAEPDYLRRGASVLMPNDRDFDNQWNLNQSSDADIDAPEAWYFRNTAQPVVVAVLDSGVRYTHEDLALNMWRNLGEIPGNGLDDDNNGWIDDIHGINAIDTATNPGDPNDDNGHGTHVAGIIGAVANNGSGVAGVAGRVQIMACKWLNSAMNGEISDLLDCIEYSIDQGAQVINGSYWGTEASLAELDAIRVAGNYGILFVTIAGNSGSDIDVDAQVTYPAGYGSDNLVTVTGTTMADALWEEPPFGSSWGLVRVDLAAPGGESGSMSGVGTAVYSTLHSSDTAYGWKWGTSMAAPHVAGCFALMRAQFPNDSYFELINRVLSTVDPLAALNGKCQTGGRLNLHRALTSVSASPPNDDFEGSFEIVIPSGQSITATGNNIGATKQSGEPSHAGNSGGRSIWWRWEGSYGNDLNIKADCSGLNPLLAVYTGTSLSTLAEVVSHGVSDDCSLAEVNIVQPLPNTTYWIAVDGYGGGLGSVQLTLERVEPPPAPTLRIVPVSLVRFAGSFSFDMAGPPNAVVDVERSPDMFDWSALDDVVLDSSGSASFTDSFASLPANFYRVRVQGGLGLRSCNAVGYVDLSVSANVQRMVANPFEAEDNSIGAMFSSPPNLSLLYKWDDDSDQFVISQYFAGTGWLPDPSETLGPGEGGIMETPASYSVSLVGEIRQGYLVTPLPSGLSIRASQVPIRGDVASGLGMPILEGDVVIRMVNGSYESFSHHNGFWIDENGNEVGEPIIEVAESFWISKPTEWKQISSVWP